MQAVILAGGFGTRLSHIVPQVPKPMAPVQDIPFLDYLYRQLLKNGCDRFLLLTGYKAEVIEEYFKTFHNVSFLREEQPLGTGGALLNALSQDLLEEEFLLVNGDTFFNADFTLLSRCHHPDSITMALRFSEDISRYGLVEIKDDDPSADPHLSYPVISFSEKTNLPPRQIDGYINAGTYLISRTVLEDLTEKKVFTGKDNPLSLENSILPLLSSQGKLYGLPLGGAFIDIGIPDDYYRAQNFIPDTFKTVLRPALFSDKDGTLIEDSGYVHGPQVTLIDPAINFIKNEYLSRGYQLVLITNQAGVAKKKFSEQEMHENLEALTESCRKCGVEFDDMEYCCYFDGAPDKNYDYRSLCRKPHPGMLLKACEKLGIDLASSVMLGDREDVDRVRLPYLECVIIKNGEIQSSDDNQMNN